VKCHICISFVSVCRKESFLLVFFIVFFLCVTSFQTFGTFVCCVTFFLLSLNRKKVEHDKRVKNKKKTQQTTTKKNVKGLKYEFLNIICGIYKFFFSSSSREFSFFLYHSSVKNSIEKVENTMEEEKKK
jgi:energy-converting hydrogenase Eha subunit H